MCHFSSLSNAQFHYPFEWLFVLRLCVQQVELSFKTGEVILVYGEMDEDGFFMGELDGVRGLVPSNFLTEAPEQYNNPVGCGPSGTQQRGGVAAGVGVGGAANRGGRAPGPGARGPPPPPRDGMIVGGPGGQMSVGGPMGQMGQMGPNNGGPLSQMNQQQQQQQRGGPGGMRKGNCVLFDFISPPLLDRL